MNKFKMQFKPYVIVFLSLAICLFVAGLVFNVISVIEYSAFSTTKTLSHTLLALLTLFLSIVVISITFFSYYQVKNGALILRFGIFRFKNDVLDIVSTTHFKKTDILVVYYKNAEYSVIMISPKLYDLFLKSLKEENPKIYVDFDSDQKNI